MRKFVRIARALRCVLLTCPVSLIITTMHLFAFSLQTSSLAGYAFVNPLSGFSEKQSLCATALFRRIVVLLSFKDF